MIRLVFGNNLPNKPSQLVMCGSSLIIKHSQWKVVSLNQHMIIQSEACADEVRGNIHKLALGCFGKRILFSLNDATRWGIRTLHAH